MKVLVLILMFASTIFATTSYNYDVQRYHQHLDITPRYLTPGEIYDIKIKFTSAKTIQKTMGWSKWDGIDTHKVNGILIANVTGMYFPRESINYGELTPENFDDLRDAAREIDNNPRKLVELRTIKNVRWFFSGKYDIIRVVKNNRYVYIILNKNR